MTSTFAGFKVRQRAPTSARRRPDPLSERMQQTLDNAEVAIAEPFKGVTADGRTVPGLYRLEKTGVSTEPIRKAADEFLAALSTEQRANAAFSLETDAWRRWSNIHPYLMRHGACLELMTEQQRERALALVEATLSQAGYQTARDIMRLNETIGEITGRDDEYGEWVYWMSIMGTPSADRPWGWQIDGHHLIVNCLVVGDQVVLTPMFMGSEPVFAPAGKYAGTRVFEPEERQGLQLMRSLSDDQQRQAIIAEGLPGEVFVGAFRDNLEFGYQGIRSGDLTSAQQDSLLELVELYVGRIRPGHDAVRMAEVSGRSRTRISAGSARPAMTASTTIGCTARSFSSSSTINAAWRWITTSRRASTFTRSSARPTATTTARTCCGSTTNKRSTPRALEYATLGQRALDAPGIHPARQRRADGVARPKRSGPDPSPSFAFDPPDFVAHARVNKIVRVLVWE